MPWFPSLSELLSWDTTDLTEGAGYWDGLADRWESAFAEIELRIRASGWEGQAADAAIERARQDTMKVTNAAQHLRDAAKIARQGASDEQAAISRLRYAVEKAWNAGFNVHDDYAVTSSHIGGTAEERAVLQAEAKAFAADIRSCAGQLVGLDARIGAKITTAVGRIGEFSFSETGGPGGFGTNKLPPLKRGEVRNLGPVAGTGSGTSGLGAGGTDLMEITPDGTTAIGGDTYTGDGNSQGDWSRSQAFGVKPGSLADPDGVKFDRTFGNNNDLYADPLAPGATTQLPAGTIMVNGKTYAMVDNTEFQDGQLIPINSRLVEVDPNNPGWRTVPGSVQPGNHAGGSQSQISGFQANDGTVYIVADGQGREHQPVLYRSNPNTFTDRSTWQPLGRDSAGKPAWNAPGAPATLDSRYGELSMRQIDGKTVLSGFNASTGRVEVRVADDPTQLFTGNAKLTVVASQQEVPQNYGGYIMPGSTLDDMKVLVSQWNGGTYNVQEFEVNANR